MIYLILSFGFGFLILLSLFEFSDELNVCNNIDGSWANLEFTQTGVAVVARILAHVLTDHQAYKIKCNSTILKINTVIRFKPDRCHVDNFSPVLSNIRYISVLCIIEFDSECLSIHTLGENLTTQQYFCQKSTIYTYFYQAINCWYTILINVSIR